MRQVNILKAQLDLCFGSGADMHAGFLPFGLAVIADHFGQVNITGRLLLLYRLLTEEFMAGAVGGTAIDGLRAKPIDTS